MQSARAQKTWFLLRANHLVVAYQKLPQIIVSSVDLAVVHQ
jgi:hypothetical protein